MPRFFIEVPHAADPEACLHAIKVLQESGSHFLTHADYGCKDGDHTARIIIEVDTKKEALMIVPRAYRTNTKVIQLNTFSVEEIDELLGHHPG